MLRKTFRQITYLPMACQKGQCKPSVSWPAYPPQITEKASRFWKPPARRIENGDVLPS